MTAQTTGLQHNLGQHDREMLDGLSREVFVRSSGACSARNRRWRLTPDIENPAGTRRYSFRVTRSTCGLMYDLLALAYPRRHHARVHVHDGARSQTTARNTQVGVNEGHHAASHHQKQAREARHAGAHPRTFHIGLFGEFLKKLDSTKDGDGSLLDHSVLLYGSNMSNSNLHDHYPLPNIVVGGGRGKLKGGQHIVCAEHTPQTNLLVTLLDKVDAKVDSLGDSSGRIHEL